MRLPRVLALTSEGRGKKGGEPDAKAGLPAACPAPAGPGGLRQPIPFHLSVLSWFLFTLPWLLKGLLLDGLQNVLCDPLGLSVVGLDGPARSCSSRKRPLSLSPSSVGAAVETRSARGWAALTNAVHVAQPAEHTLGHLADAVVMDAELHQGARQVGRDLHQVVLRDVELLQLPQGAEGLLMDLGNLVVHQDEGLRQNGSGGDGTRAQPALPSPLPPSSVT